MDYKKVQGALANQIKNYSNLPIRDSDDLTDQPDAPYIAINQLGPVGTYTGAAMNGFIKVRYRIEIITEGGTPDDNPTAKPQAANIADWLRKLWFFEKPKYELLNQGIEPVQPCTTLGTSATYLVNFNQFTDGVDLTVVVRDDFNDTTVPGRIDVIKTNYSNKPIKKRND